MLVLCIEGAHGCGKTELVRLFEAAGLPVLDEMFMNLPHHFDGLDAQSMVREVAWVTHWVERILRYKQEHPSVKVVVADRSPYSAVVYANRGMSLRECISTQLQELQEHADIRVVTVMLQVEPETHWQRISERLEREPERMRYNESSKDWMLTVRQRYEQLSSADTWTMTVQNDIPGALETIKQVILDYFEQCTPK